MPDQEAINRDLRSSVDSPFQRKVLDEVRGYLKVSSDHMSQYWETWENNDKVYRGFILPDKEDRTASTKNEPTKIIVPVTYAQIQTAVSFIFSTFTQRDNIFEVTGFSPEDKMSALNIEHDLSYQTRKQQYLLKLYNWLLDAFKVGFGVTKTTWQSDFAHMRVKKEVSAQNIFQKALNLNAGSTRIEEVIEEVLQYEGNVISNISPYCFFPDPDVTIANFQDGIFVGHEEEMSRSAMLNKEGDIYHGVKHIPDSISKEVFHYRKRFPHRDRQRGVEDFQGRSAQGVEDVQNIIASEVSFKIIPATWSKAFGINFGKETHPVQYIAVIGNDSKLVRFEPAGYLHNKFNYSVIEYSPDHNSFCNPGLSTTIHELQGLVNWFLNSHIVGVRRVLKNKIAVDPTSVEMGDITSDSPAIRLKAAGVKNIDRVLKQLNVQDVTSNHVNDIQQINQIIQMVTGINENALGQFAKGRRSAQEARQVGAGASARLRMHAQLAWYQGIEPQGRQMLSNTRQGRTKPVYDQIVGELATKRPYEQVILTDPQKIAGGYDFVPYDATLPTDKERRASVFGEVFQVLLSNPEAAQAFDINPVTILNHMMELNGITNLKDFSFAAATNNLTPNAQVVPDQVALEAQQAGAQPVDLGGNQLLQEIAQSVG